MFPILAGSNPLGYNFTRSLRVRASASAYLSKAAYGTGGGITTWAAWVKRGTLGVTNQILFTSTDRSDYYDWFGFNSSDQLTYWHRYNNSDAYFSTSAVFRDPSAWYFIQVVIDSTQASNANRVKIYINGTQQSLTTTGTFTQNQAIRVFSSSSATNICGTSAYITSNYFDGYLAEMNLIDGQALTPSSFGETDAITGVWQPAPYTGSYGTNGFILDFEDNSALTTSSNVGLGKDTSGNGNYWTTNNISITSGVTYDSMTDVPTLTSATAANFAVLNPLDQTGTTVSDGNLKTVISAGGSNVGCGSFAMTSGKWYWEVTATAINNNSGMIGVADQSVSLANRIFYNVSGGWYYESTGLKWNSSTTGASYGASYTTNDIIGIAYDADAGSLTFYKNNTSQGVAFNTGLAGKLIVPSFNNSTSGATQTYNANFGQRPFSYTPPTGFVALNTYNLPTPTIAAGSAYMNAGLYTGTGSATALPVSGPPNPDFVWIKCRSSALSHSLLDSLRSTATPYSLRLYSNATNAEYNYGSSLLTPTSTGFNLITTDGDHNTNGATYVAWQWQAGQGTTSSNTNGTITSTVSVNASAGFSVVTWTGTGSNATVGHGLGVAPSMVIVKNRSATSDWLVQNANLTSYAYGLVLSGTNAQTNAANWWNSTAPTSSVFSVGNGSIAVNGNGNSMVAYCFAPIAGYSAFGSVNGNGSSDGPMIYTGFLPRFILYKRTDTTSDWRIWDTARNTYNAMSSILYPNDSGAEYTASTQDFDALSNGFKVRNSSAAMNASGGTYIYAAFATSPFKYALAR